MPACQIVAHLRLPSGQDTPEIRRSLDQRAAFLLMDHAAKGGSLHTPRGGEQSDLAHGFDMSAMTPRSADAGAGKLHGGRIGERRVPGEFFGDE
jgi:hypothetical protein